MAEKGARVKVGLDRWQVNISAVIARRVLADREGVLTIAKACVRVVVPLGRQKRPGGWDGRKVEGIVLSKESETATEWAKRVLEFMDPGEQVATVEEWVRVRARMLLCGLALAGYGRIRVIQGWRRLGECERQYGLGRTEEECAEAGVSVTLARPADRRVTWIVPKYNRHGLRRALDVDFTMYQDLNEDVIDRTARAVGMTWGGVWSVRDTYHFEI